MSDFLKDWTDLLVDERVGEILKECEELRRDNIRRLDYLIQLFHGEFADHLDAIITELMEDSFCSNKICYGAGFEDGIRFTRKLLSLSFDFSGTDHIKMVERRVLPAVQNKG